MEDLSPRKPPQLAIKAEDTSPTGENGALVWSTQEGRLLTYNEDAGRWGVVGAYPALSSVRIPGVVYYTFIEVINFSTFSLVANRQYFLPFYLTSDTSIATISYEVTTAASSGTAAVGIYNTQLVNGISMPYELLTSATNMNITTSGIKTATVSPSITLRAGFIYWVSIHVTGNVALRTGTMITRMLLNSTTPLLCISTVNTTGNLVNPAPSTSGSYAGHAFLPFFFYT